MFFFWASDEMHKWYSAIHRKGIWEKVCRRVDMATSMYTGLSSIISITFQLLVVDISLFCGKFLNSVELFWVSTGAWRCCAGTSVRAGHMPQV